MNFKKIRCLNPQVDTWHIEIDSEREEVFVPEFCVYILAVEKGKLRCSSRSDKLTISSNQVLCLPPLTQSIKISLESKTQITVHRIDPWYFISNIFEIPKISTLSINTPDTKIFTNMIKYLKLQSSKSVSKEKVEIVRKFLETKEYLLSNKQINRYLKAWFGITLSKFDRINEVELFVKQKCNFGNEKTTLIDNVDYDSFHDYSHFGHTFKSMIGVSPESYLSSDYVIQSLFW